MRATFTEEQVQLQAVAGEIAKGGRPAAPPAHATIPAADAATEALFAGFTGLAVPEDAGGAGGDLVDLAIVCHELGRQVVATPFVPHVMAVQVAHGAGLDVAAGASGDEVWTLAADEVSAPPLGPWTATADPLGGTKPRVPFGATADHVVAVLGDDTVAVLAVPDARADDATFDLGRPTATLDLAPAGVTAVGGGARAGLLRALPLLAAELVGVGRGAVELAAAYARDREQFGTPIGRFQGVAHQLADALVAVEEAWSLTLFAAWAVDAGDAAATRAVHVAKASASEAAVFAAERCTQVHGGIGITWEALPHLYLRRAVSGATWLGDAAWHRQRVGADLLAG